MPEDRSKPTLLNWPGLRFSPVCIQSRSFGQIVRFFLVAAALLLLGRFLTAAFVIVLDDRAIRNFGFVLAGLFGASFVVWRSKVAPKQAGTAKQKFITGLINKAVEGFGLEKTVKRTINSNDSATRTEEQTVPNIGVRVVAIYTLERIAPDSDHARIMEICRAALGLFAAMLAAPTLAEPSLLPDVEQPAWNAIGRVNVAGLKRRSMCSGTLVAPDSVLTAAHCLRRADGSLVRTESVHFVSGWRKGEFVFHSKALNYDLEIRFTVKPGETTSDFPDDSALVTLENPAPADLVQPLPLAALPADADTVDLIGYRRDRPHALSRQEGCRVLKRSPDLLGLDCEVIPGSSGGPVLWNGPDGWRVVGLVSAAVTSDGPVRALAIPVSPDLLDR